MSKTNAGNGRKNNNKGNQGDVGANAARSVQGRQRIRKQSALLDSRREAERQDGSFYLRVNANRSNDIYAAVAGTVGLYAHPGGDQPSVHFNVQKEVGKSGSQSVIRLESIQIGHPLNGAVFSQGTFLPCTYIQKFGSAFASRMDDRLAASTQKLICNYFSDIVGTPQGADEVQEELQPVEYDASENFADALDGVSGYYRRVTEAGGVVLEVFVTKYPVVRIEHSTVEGIEPSKIFLPLHVAMGENLTPGNLPEEVLSQQRAIFDLLKTVIAENKAKQLESAPAVKPEKKKVGAKELAKAGVKRAKKIAVSTAEADKATALASIRKVLITNMQAINGRPGFVEMSNLSGELIVQIGMIGNDRVVSVEHIGESHMLRIATVNIGTKVFVSQVLNGLIDRVDAENLRMTQDDVKRGNAFIGYIRSYFESNRIRLQPRKAPDLKKVA